MTIPKTYDLGDKIRATATFTDMDGIAIDPTVVKFSVKSGLSDTITYTYGGAEIAKPSTGVYYLDVDLDAAGEWHIRAWSTGAGQASQESKIRVKQPVAV